MPAMWAKGILAAAAILLSAAAPLPAAAAAGQPFASYWHPNTLLAWDPAADPDAPHNRAAVPLAEAFLNPALNGGVAFIPGHVDALPSPATAPTATSKSRTRNLDANDVNAQAAWSPDLTESNWSAQFVTDTLLFTDGRIQHRAARVPIGTANPLFFRIQTPGP